MTSLFLVYKQNPLYEGQGPQKMTHKPINEPKDLFEVQPPLYFDLERDSTPTSWTRPSPTSSCMSSDNKNELWNPQNHIMNEKLQKPENSRTNQKTKSPNSKTLLENCSHCDQEMSTNELVFQFNQLKVEVMSRTHAAEIIPFLWAELVLYLLPYAHSIRIKHHCLESLQDGFSYDELEEATSMLSDVSFIAEGGFGVVHKGILRDGQVVAVKQLKFSGSQADLDFCREVRLLSCAQHRNVVLFIGFCTEGNLSIVVYEDICNGSLDLYLQGEYAFGLELTLKRLELHEDCATFMKIVEMVLLCTEILDPKIYS